MTKVKNWLRQVNTVSSPFYTPKTEGGGGGGGIKIGLRKGGYKNLSYERSGLPKRRFP